MRAQARKSRFFEFWRVEVTLPEPEAFVNKPRKMTGFFASLSEKGKEKALAFDGAEENHGDSEFVVAR